MTKFEAQVCALFTLCNTLQADTRTHWTLNGEAAFQSMRIALCGAADNNTVAAADITSEMF